MEDFGLLIIIWILFGHYVSDVLLQKASWAESKHNNFFSLLKHTVVYTLIITLFTGFMFETHEGFTKFIVLTFLSHTFIDFVTSKMDGRLKLMNRTRNRVKLMLFDQFLHAILLFIGVGLWTG